MNELYNRALDLFESNQFSEAYPLFLSLAKSQQLDSELRENSYAHLLQCYSYDVELKTDNLIEYEFAEFLFENKKYKAAHDILKRYIEETKNKKGKDANSLMWKISYELGLLEIVYKFLENEVSRLTRKGDANALLKLEEEIRERGLRQDLELKVKGLAAVIRGEYEIFDMFYRQYIRSKLNNSKDYFLSNLLQGILGLPRSTRDEFYKSSQGKILFIIGQLGEKELNLKELKEVVSHFFEAITLKIEKPIIELILCEYCLKAKRTDFILLCEELFSSDKKGLYKARYQEKIKREEKNYTAMRTIDQSEIDFGTDLFREENRSGYDTGAKKQKLEREIQLLKKAEKNKEADLLIIELSKIDDEHPLVKELNEREIGDVASRTLKKRNGVDEVRDKISHEIARFSQKIRAEETQSNELSLLYLKNIEYMDEQEFKKNQKDLIMSSFTQGLSKVALSILDDPRSEISKEGLEYKYFKVIALTNMGQEHEALDTLNEILESMALVPDEKITFLYIKAEVLRSLGKRIEAFKIYREVYKINPHYRLAKYRMSEIDQL